MPRTVLLAFAIALATLPATADVKHGATDAAVDGSAIARDHFRKAVKLFEDQNFTGALAEFEAAYAAKATASSLQNIALCLKALYRYAQAAETLDKLLARHATELGADERAAVEQARDELTGLIGVVQLTTVPADARVLFDGRAVTPEERAQGVRLDVGEHRVEASAPGYAAESKILRIAASRQPRQERIVLRAVMGFIEVVASDPEAAIAVDGEPRGYHRQRVAVEPGDHTVTIYKEGLQSYERAVTLVAGQSVVVRGDPGASGPSGGEQHTPSTGEGWYVFGALSAIQAAEPAPFEGSDKPQGGAIGARGGYRPWKALSFEGQIELLSATAKACVPTAAMPCAANAPERDYTIGVARFGPSVRVTTLADQWRLFAALGFGVAANTITVDEGDGGRTRADDSAASGYASLELGGEINFGHFVLGLALTAAFHGAPALELEGEKIYEGDAPLNFGGVSVRGGWSEWTSP
jgi:hypothetical protein